jgi:Fe(3+) dicitrate transport protein
MAWAQQPDSADYKLEEVEIRDRQQVGYALRSLRNVEGTAIYAGKKTEVVQLSNIQANLATNNAREVYKGVAGLNIWESDGAGLQLSIGARGLDPNRTANFNTRQNGYDISADALGYPESYYTPPTQALKRIEIVRGAASLQYGPQFGGLLNFVMKEGNSEKAFSFLTENTLGSFGFLSSFNSIGGEKDGWNYYAFFQRKQGDGWRPNESFFQNTAYAKVSKEVIDKFKIGVEVTHMNYLAQQAGGLMDFEFAQDARQSKRTRNWFQVNWNLAALTADWRISDRTRFNSRTFLLDAQRDALGELGPIHRPDPLRERDLISGKYRNWGTEARLIHRYSLFQLPSNFLVGARYYQGYSQSMQGLASEGSDADFRFLNPNEPERFSYEFPSQNLAFFIENLFYLSPKWTVTPGIRVEHIETNADGYFKRQVFSGGQVIFEEMREDQQTNSRSFALLGLGIGHKLKRKLEAYLNFSQNYRSINFSDLAVFNPNLIVDSLLKDERGFNADLGLRGKIAKDKIQFDLSGFFLSYQDRIGLGEIIQKNRFGAEQAVAFRTNIGNARILGLEFYGETDILRWLSDSDLDQNFNSSSLLLFLNASALHGLYTSGRPEIVGNQVELIPPFSLKSGLSYRYKNLKASLQGSYVAEHFSDATNATYVVDATRGVIPAYAVMDCSIGYNYKRYSLQGGINNMTDARYFTRRATAYPGPGIIPANGRSFYVTLGLSL